MAFDRRWLPLNALRAFEAVGRHLSFTAAANSLLVSQSAVSRHVIALERLLGVQLFERRPHRLLLTSAGRALLPAVSKSYDRLEQALNEIVTEPGRLRRVLRVQMPSSFAHHVAVPILKDFRRACPEVVIDVESLPQAGAGATRDVDLAVTYAKPQVTDLVTDLLWPARLTPLCHPELAARFEGASLAAFLEANELVHMKLEGQPRHILWERFVTRMGLAGLAVDRGLVFDTELLAARYALSGEGVALLDATMFGDELRRGELVRPYDDCWLEEGYGYYLLLHPDDLGDEAIAMFRTWLIGRFAEGRPDGRVGGGHAAPVASGEAGSTVVALDRHKRRS